MHGIDMAPSIPRSSPSAEYNLSVRQYLVAGSVLGTWALPARCDGSMEDAALCRGWPPAGGEQVSPSALPELDPVQRDALSWGELHNLRTELVSVEQVRRESLVGIKHHKVRSSDRAPRV